MLVPVNVQAIGDEVAIRWTDGGESYYPMELLRAASPSAENIGEKDLLGIVHGGSPATDYVGIRVVSWRAIGGYALQFEFSDGHNTGIFSYDYLQRLSKLLEGE